MNILFIVTKWEIQYVQDGARATGVRESLKIIVSRRERLNNLSPYHTIVKTFRVLSRPPLGPSPSALFAAFAVSLRALLVAAQLHRGNR